MSKNDFRASEKRWRRKRLFRKSRPRRLPHIAAALLILAALAMVAWWLDLPPFNLAAQGVLL